MDRAQERIIRKETNMSVTEQQPLAIGDDVIIEGWNDLGPAGQISAINPDDPSRVTVALVYTGGHESQSMQCYTNELQKANTATLDFLTLPLDLRQHVANTITTASRLGFAPYGNVAEAKFEAQPGEDGYLRLKTGIMFITTSARTVRTHDVTPYREAIEELLRASQTLTADRVREMAQEWSPEVKSQLEELVKKCSTESLNQTWGDIIAKRATPNELNGCRVVGEELYRRDPPSLEV
jgi:hypothetical protein